MFLLGTDCNIIGVKKNARIRHSSLSLSLFLSLSLSLSLSIYIYIYIYIYTYSLNLVEWNLTQRDWKFSLSWKKSENMTTLIQEWQIFTLFKEIYSFGMRFVSKEWNLNLFSGMRSIYPVVYILKKRIEISLLWKRSF